MALADWVGNRKRAAEVAEAAVEIDLAAIPDSIHTAAGWRVISDDFYTCVQPVGGPVHDKAVVAAIHSFDPGAIPMWRKQRYLPPGSTSAVVFSHLAFGRYVRFPRRELALFYVEMPYGSKAQMPNELLMIWEFFDARYMFEGGPGGVFPSDMRQYRYMRADYLRGDQKGADRLSAREAEATAARDARRKSHADDYAYKKRRLDAYVNRRLEEPGDNELAFREWKWRQHAGRSPRPFVYLRGEK